jgi:hypothetical protein
MVEVTTKESQVEKSSSLQMTLALWQCKVDLRPFFTSLTKVYDPLLSPQGARLPAKRSSVASFALNPFSA